VALVVWLRVPAALVMLPPPMPHPTEKNNQPGASPLMPHPEKKTIHLQHWWFGSMFAAALVMFPPLMWHPSKKNQPAALLASMMRRQNNSTCSIGGLASHFQWHWQHFFNAASPKKTRQHCWPPLKPCTGYKINNQPAGLVASDATPKRNQSTSGIGIWFCVSHGVGGLAPCFQQHWQHCLLQCRIPPLPKKTINLQGY